MISDTTVNKDGQNPMDAILQAPAGVTISLDETGEFPQLIVSFPSGLALPKNFVRECHQLAGENGAGIEFQERL